ncbi:MAG: hypothetical protein AAFX81_08250 [Pseudomonadota bacterium]
MLPTALVVLPAAGTVAADSAAVRAVEPATEQPPERPRVRFGRHPGFRRMAVEWRAPVGVTFEIDDELVRVVFDRLTELDAGRIDRGLARVVRDVEVGADGLVLRLRDGVRVEWLQLRGNRVLAVDFYDPDTRRTALASLVPQLRPSARETTPLAAGRQADDANATARPAEPNTAAHHTGSALVRPAPPPTAVPGPADMVPAADATPDAGPAPAVAQPPSAAPGEPPPEPEAAPAPTRHDVTPDDTDANVEPVPADPQPSVGSLPPLPTVVVEPAVGPSHDEDPPASPAPATDDPVPSSDAAHAPPPAPPDHATAKPHDHDHDVDVADDEPAAGSPVAGPIVTSVENGWDITFPAVVPAAALRRGDDVWFVVAEAAVDAPPLIQAPDAVDAAHVAGAWVFRFQVGPIDGVEVQRSAKGWRIVLGQDVAPAAPSPTPPEHDGGEATLTVMDSWLGEPLYVQPSLDPHVRRYNAARRGSKSYLPTLLGQVWRDAVAGPSTTPQLDVGPIAPPPPLGNLIDLAGRTLDGPAALAERRQLTRALFAHPAPARRLALARHLLGEGAPFEALAVLEAGNPDALDDEVAARERMRALRGVANVLADRHEAAALDLPAVDPDDAEPALWQAMLAARSGDWVTAGSLFARSGQVWRDYPMPLRRLVAHEAGRAALHAGAPAITLALLRQVGDDVTDPALVLLEAEALAQSGDAEAAGARLAALGRSEDDDVRRRAQVAQLGLGLEREEPVAATTELEAMLPYWTGRPDEAELWWLLGDYRARAGDAAGALDAWAEARRRPTVGLASRPPDRDRALLESAIRGEPPFDGDLAAAVTATKRHADLVPEGPERAALFHELATRVAAESDALHVADSLLVHALAMALPRAQEVELRLALAHLRLRRHVPAQALAALEPLDDVEHEDVAPLRGRAAGLRAGPEPVVETAQQEAVPPELPVTAPVDAATEALEAARRLLEGQ